MQSTFRRFYTKLFVAFIAAVAVIVVINPQQTSIHQDNTPAANLAARA